MLRWRIVRTLLYKEALRYRYNWGLLVMVVALLALAGLISVSARMGKLPGQDSQEVPSCVVYYDQDDSRIREYGAYLGQVEPPTGGAVRLRPVPAKEMRKPLADDLRLPVKSMAVMVAPTDREPGRWTVRFLYSGDPAGTILYHDWFMKHAYQFLNDRPVIQEHSRKVKPEEDRSDAVPIVITALTIFALYLLSFNLFLTSTGEERDKRVMLGLLLTPATATEVVAAKAIFYGASSLGVALAVVAMYQPALLGRPLLWSTVLLGSVSYVCIGTVFVSIVRRQTTISTVSMLYLIATSVVMFLSQFLPLFTVLKFFMVEDYLYRQMHQIVSGQSPWWVVHNQIILAGLTCGWVVVAVAVFSRRSTAIAQAR